jgi:hypothetical protein
MEKSEKPKKEMDSQGLAWKKAEMQSMQLPVTARRAPQTAPYPFGISATIRGKHLTTVRRVGRHDEKPMGHLC